MYEFGPFCLEPAELLCHGKPKPLQKRHIAVLRLLVRNSPKVVTYEQFLKEAWGRIVQENNVSGCISILRKTLASEDDSQLYIKSHPGIGYSFTVSPLRSPMHRLPSPRSPLIAIFSNVWKPPGCGATDDVPFRTPNAILTLLDMTSGFTEKAFNAAKSGFGSSLKKKLRLFVTETQPYIDRKRVLETQRRRLV